MSHKPDDEMGELLWKKVQESVIELANNPYCTEEHFALKLADVLKAHIDYGLVKPSSASIEFQKLLDLFRQTRLSQQDDEMK